MIATRHSGIALLAGAAVFCLLVSAVRVGWAREALTLDQVMRTALEKSPLLAASASDLGASKEGEIAARGALLPRMDGYSSYMRLSDPQAVVPIKGFGGTPPTFSRDQYKVGVGVKVPLYEGGRLRTQISMAELSRRISEQSLSLTRQELIYDITNVFNQILFLKGLEAAQSETLMALEKDRVDAKTRLDVGRLAPVDLMRIDTQVSEQEQALIQTREESVRALYTLAQLMGAPPGQIADVRGELEEIAPPVTAPGGIDGLDGQLKNRPDIKRASESVALAKRAIRLEEGLHLPAIDLVGDYGRRAGSGLLGDEEVWSGGVILEFNIFSGGVISARVREARQRYFAEKHRLEHLRLQAMREIEAALSSLKEAGQRCKTARVALKDARESSRIEAFRYKTGAGTVTDSLLAQAAWLQARANVLRALFDLNRAEADYRLALGIMDQGVKK